MASLTSDLDKFLKTDGLRILVESGAVRTEPYEPLTVEDIDDFADMSLDELDTDHLEDLLEKAEDLRDDLEDEEPDDENSNEYDLWSNRLSETEDFIDRIQERLDELEDEENEDDEDASTVTERIIWKNKT